MGTNQNESTKILNLSDIELNPKNKKGIIIISVSNFITRIWFLLSNPFRYIFTGKLRY